MTKLGWIGLGKCGLPIAEAINKSYNVVAYDLLQKQSEVYTDNITNLLDADITFVLVETPHINKNLDGSIPINLSTVEDYDYTALRSVLLDLSNNMYKGIVVVSSTVSPGTIKQLSQQHNDLRIVYMPVMIHIGSVARDFISSPSYYIGTQDKHVFDQVSTIMRSLCPGTVIKQGTYEEVEMWKMFGNIFSSVKIAFANTISEMIEYGNFNASSWNIMEALLNEKQNFNTTAYLTPGSGNGGPCHPRDGVVLSWLTDKLKMQSQLLKNITQVRQDQALALAKHLVSYKLPIIILGKSFKQGVDLTVGSYSVLVGEYCTELGASVTYDDISKEPSVVLLAHPNKELLEKYQPAQQSIIVDLWNLGIPNAKVWGNNLS
jgi:UDPglucose 6-dehydrogenase